jgi:FkbM family methyltransferase
MAGRLQEIAAKVREGNYRSRVRRARARRSETRELERQGVQIADLGDGMKLMCDLRVNYDRSVYLGKEEVRERRLLSLLLGPGDVFVDCGANIGLFAVAAAGLVGAQGTVFAVEPVAGTFARLRENCELNELGDRVHLFENVLGAQSGAEVALAGDVHNTMRVDSGAPAGSPLVKTVTLDEILAETPAVTGIKLDVEGYELEVLRGAEDTIARFSPWMLIEFNAELLGTRELREWDVHGFLSERSYIAHLPGKVLAGDRTPVPDSWASPRPYVNLLYSRGELPVS